MKRRILLLTLAIEAGGVMAFGWAAYHYARAVPPTVKIGMSLGAFVTSRMVKCAFGIALLHLGALAGIAAARAEQQPATVRVVLVCLGLVLAISAALTFAGLILFSFPQY